MPTLIANCPFCGQKHTFRPVSAGTLRACARCRKKFELVPAVVPTPEPSAHSPREPSRVFASLAWTVKAFRACAGLATSAIWGCLPLLLALSVLAVLGAIVAFIMVSMRDIPLPPPHAHRSLTSQPTVLAPATLVSISTPPSTPARTPAPAQPPRTRPPAYTGSRVFVR